MAQGGAVRSGTNALCADQTSEASQSKVAFSQKCSEKWSSFLSATQTKQLLDTALVAPIGKLASGQAWAATALLSVR